MDFVLDEETNYYCYGGNVYESHGYHDEKVDDRADLFIALRNMAVNIIPNLAFKDADCIHRPPTGDTMFMKVKYNQCGKCRVNHIPENCDWFKLQDIEETIIIQ